MEKTNQPLYQQLMEDVRSQIENSLLLPGDKLPTEREFMQKYNVSRITVSKALNELKAEGLITRFPNKGSFVARSASPLAAAAQVPLEAPSVLLPASASAQLPAVPEGSTSDTAFTEIACILPSISDQFSLSMVNGILSAFPMDSYICHLFQSFNPSLENRLLQKCIDTGISGRTAQKVSERLSYIGRKHQVLCITHLPQIAAMADTHFEIRKSVQNGMTSTKIQKLNEQEQTGELARLLGGAEITEKVLENAEEMKRLAKETKTHLDSRDCSVVSNDVSMLPAAG